MTLGKGSSKGATEQTPSPSPPSHRAWTPDVVDRTGSTQQRNTWHRAEKVPLSTTCCWSLPPKARSGLQAVGCQLLSWGQGRGGGGKLKDCFLSDSYFIRFWGQERTSLLYVCSSYLFALGPSTLGSWSLTAAPRI